MSEKDPTKAYEPLPELPIFEASALTRPGPGDSPERFADNLKAADLFRFVFGNLGYTDEEVHALGQLMLNNVVLQPDQPLYMLFVICYFLGVMDGVRLQMAQAAVDAQRVKMGVN